MCNNNLGFENEVKKTGVWLKVETRVKTWICRRVQLFDGIVLLVQFYLDRRVNIHHSLIVFFVVFLFRRVLKIRIYVYVFISEYQRLRRSHSCCSLCPLNCVYQIFFYFKVPSVFVTSIRNDIRAPLSLYTTAGCVYHICRQLNGADILKYLTAVLISDWIP